MNRLALLASTVVAACATSATVTTTPATLVIAPDGMAGRAVSANHDTRSAFVQVEGDAYRVVFTGDAPGTDCTAAAAGAGTLTFYIPTQPPLVANPSGDMAEPLDVAAAEGVAPFGGPHGELDLAVATRETVGGLYFVQTATGFSGQLDATTTDATGLASVTGSFDAPMCP
jgi:hypothetical protein